MPSNASNNEVIQAGGSLSSQRRNRPTLRRRSKSLLDLPYEIRRLIYAFWFAHVYFVLSDATPLDRRYGRRYPQIEGIPPGLFEISKSLKQDMLAVFLGMGAEFLVKPMRGNIETLVPTLGYLSPWAPPIKRLQLPIEAWDRYLNKLGSDHWSQSPSIERVYLSTVIIQRSQAWDVCAQKVVGLAKSHLAWLNPLYTSSVNIPALLSTVDHRRNFIWTVWFFDTRSLRSRGLEIKLDTRTGQIVRNDPVIFALQRRLCEETPVETNGWRNTLVTEDRLNPDNWVKE